MSSFKTRVAQAEKKKNPKSANVPVTDLEENTARTESSESVIADKGVEASLYGEDQEETAGQAKWERPIPLDRIRPNPFQPRKTFDPTKLDELASGMKEHGWIGGGLPVRAHATEANVYELVWGERRWRAALLAGLSAIPCVISVYSDEDLIEKGLLENIQREDLSNLEEGLAYVSLLTLRTEQGKPRYSIRRLAERLGKDKSYIEDRLQYARVPLDVQQLAVDQPDISPRIIRELGELSKVLQPEERAPVIDSVREGQLRIEDVREIRKEVEQKIKSSVPVEQLPITPQVSVATDTPYVSPLIEQQTDGVNRESAPSIQDAVPSDTAPPGPTPLTKTMTVSVFERSLKRDSETLERIFQRIAERCETLTEDERMVLSRYLQQWNVTLQTLLSTTQRREMNEKRE